MNHRLISPLIQQWRDRIFPTIKYNNSGGSRLAISTHFFDKLIVIIKPLIQFLSKHRANLRPLIVPNFDILGPKRHQRRVKPVCHPQERRVIHLRPFSDCFAANRHHCGHFQREELRVDGLEVQVRFLNLIDYVVRIILSKLLQHPRFNFVGEDWAKNQISDQVKTENPKTYSMG